MLAFSACFCFTIANLILGYLSKYGSSASMMYFNSGAFLLAIVYFVLSEKKEKKLPLDKRRVLLKNSSGNFDFNLIKFYFVGALFNLFLMLAMSQTFVFCQRAGLNVGVAQAIWCFTPAIVSLLDYFIYGLTLKFFHITGLLLMFAAGTCISLSNFYKTATSFANPENPVPIYVPVFMSCCIPVMFSTFSIFSRYVFRVIKITALDYTFGYMMLVRGSCMMVSIGYFVQYGINT